MHYKIIKAFLPKLAILPKIWTIKLDALYDLG